MNCTKSMLSVVLSVACTVGCASDESEHAVATSDSALLASGSHLYFRSNATGWGVDDATRLANFIAPNVYVATFQVTAPWMVDGMDTATLTETNALNSWGTSQTFYKAVQEPVVTGDYVDFAAAPNGTNPHFNVDYAVLGLHRILVNMNADPPAFIIESKDQVCGGAWCPNNLHCELPASGIPFCAVNPGTCGSVPCPQ